MELYLIRHGQSQCNLEGRYAGWGDTPLTALGVSQARAAGERLRGVRFNRYYCSDIYRTRQTFLHAFGADVQPEYTPLLREVNSGDLVGRLIAQARAAMTKDELEKLQAWDFHPFHGDDPADVTARVTRFLDTMAQLPEDTRVAAVSHGAAMRVMGGVALGLAFPHVPLVVDNCGICVLAHEKNGRWVVRRWNVTDTL